MRKQDIEKESFYTSPPYNYRPSISEYLTNLKVTKKGVIADIMHLDRKKNLYIQEFQNDGLVIQLKDKKDLNDNEFFLWDFLEKKADKGIVTVKFWEIKRFSKKYEAEVVSKASEKFGSRFKFPKSFFGLMIFGFIINIIWGVINSFINVFVGLISLLIDAPHIELIKGNFSYLTALFIGFIIFIIVLIQTFFITLIGLRKIHRSKIEKKYLLKRVLFGIFKLQACYVLFVFTLIVLFLLLGGGGSIIIFFLYLFLLPFYFYFIGKIASRFLYWLFENQETEENRVRWLAFKDFVIDNSEIEKKELKYYRMWDAFYYYALAVGAIKKPYGPS
jgi:hypothetical protein